MSVNLEAKQELVEEIKSKIQKAKSLTFVDYRGMSVQQDTKMRAAFRKVGAEYKVYKNRLMLRALNELGLTGYDKILEGTNAVAFGYDDEIGPNKVVVDTMKEVPSLKIKGGMLDGQMIDEAYIKALASIPSKEVLLTKLLYILQSPMRGLAVVLNGIAEKKTENN